MMINDECYRPAVQSLLSIRVRQKTNKLALIVQGNYFRRIASICQCGPYMLLGLKVTIL